MPITLPLVSPQAHTHLTYEGYPYVKEHVKGNDYSHRVLQAFFVQGKHISQNDVLRKRAGQTQSFDRI